tara:strand:+ start:3006 stop:4706 length:1701 start_codon:yes stop_codon:yes gene_type:complete
MTLRLTVDNANTFAVSASVHYTAISVAASRFVASSVEKPRLIFGAGGGIPEVLPQTNLPTESVSVGDGDTGFAANLTKSFTTTKGADDEALPSDVLNRFDIDLIKTDSVTVTETRVKVFTDFIDFDPSDADIDATPVTIAEADAKDVDKPFSDTTSATEAISNQPDLPKTDSVTASDAVDDFDVNKAATDTATASEAIDRFDVTTEFGDTVTVTEAIENEVTIPKSDSVAAVQSNVKTFTSNVDFDLSDADVDPDPVTASDAINDFDIDKGLTDTATATEADAKNFTHGGFTDALTAVEGIKLEPTVKLSSASSGAQTFVITVVSSGGNKFAIDGVTNPVLELFSGITYTFDVSDSSNSGHPLRFKDGSSSYTDGVTTSGTAGQSNATVTFAVPNDAPTSTLLYYCTVHGNAMGNSISVPNSITANQILAVESAVFDVQSVFSDTATATESIHASLAIGDLTFMYPDFVTVSDGYIGGFIKEPYSYTISNTEYFVPNTGVIGAAETLNTVIMAADRVTAPDESSSGLVVNFHYTDVDEDDRALGGYQFNQTPLNPGNSTVGQRAIL